jgi:hypothetical protein
MDHELEDNRELQRVLWSCLAYWQEPSLAKDRLICYRWVIGAYRSRFASEFHPSRLNELSKLGLLAKGDTSRGGNRRYFTIPDPERIEALLRKWSLN